MKKILVTAVAIALYILCFLFGMRLEAGDQMKSGRLSSINNGMADREERILFQGGDDSIYSMRPDGSDKRVVDPGPAWFLISPDGNWMLVLAFEVLNDRYTEVPEIRLYDFQKARFRSLTLPEGHWVKGGAWWSEDSRKLHMYSAVTDKGEPFVRTANLNDAKESKVDRTLTCDLDSGRFEIKEYKENPPVLLDFLAGRGASPRSSCAFPAPDGRYTLKWDVPDDIKTYGEPCGEHRDIVLLSIGDSSRRIVFEHEVDKFDASVFPITERPWSPDSSHFVLEKFFGGFWRIFLRSAETRRGIYIIDRETLKWRFIAYGSSPYWFANFPLEFIEDSEPR